MPFLDYVGTPFAVELCEREEWNIFKGTHFHNCYELYYLAQGEITYFVEQNIYPVQRGQFILIPPGALHKTMPCHDQRHKRILVYIDAAFMEEFLKDDPGLFDCFGHTLLTVVKKSAAERILYALLDEAEGEQNPVMVKSLLGELLCLLGRWTAHDALPSPDAGGAAAEKVMEAVRYINAHFAQDIRLGTLAGALYISPTYLSRCFRQVMGIPYCEYLNKVRVREAVRLLTDTDLRVADIAPATGFHSDNHLCKIFRQVMGISPLQYRRRQVR